MNTIIPIFIPRSSSRPPEDPNCPHCKKKLRGWSKPSSTSFKEGLAIALLVLVIASQTIGVIGGSVEGDFHQCDSFGEKRYHYLLPTYVGGCMAMRWITNEKFITRKDYETYQEAEDKRAKEAWDARMKEIEQRYKGDSK